MTLLSYDISLIDTAQFILWRQRIEATETDAAIQIVRGWIEVQRASGDARALGADAVSIHDGDGALVWHHALPDSRVPVLALSCDRDPPALSKRDGFSRLPDSPWAGRPDREDAPRASDLARTAISHSRRGPRIAPASLRGLSERQRGELFVLLGTRWFGGDQFCLALAEALGEDPATVANWRREPRRIPLLVLLLLVEWTGDGGDTASVLAAYTRLAEDMSRVGESLRASVLLAAPVSGTGKSA